MNAPISKDLGRQSGRVAVNSLWSLAGQLLPLIVGVLTLPALIRAMGLERYGFLTLVWVLVGYASLFDFGIGRALTRAVASALASTDDAVANRLAQVGCTYLLTFGILVGLALAVGTPWLAAHALGLPQDLQAEAQRALWILAASVPMVMLSSGYAGVLTAHQHFRSMSVLRAVLGIAGFIGPLLVATQINRLEYVVAFVLCMRIINNAALARACRRQCAFDFHLSRPDRATSNALFSLGGWITVSNLVSPLLTYLDRLLLGSLVPIRAVAFYATPFDLLSRSMILPYSIMGALFPSAAGLQRGSEEARVVLEASVRLLYALMWPIMLAFMALAEPGLRAWLGNEFAANAAPVLQVLAAGVFLNALAQAPATLVQAAGHPRWMAKMHLIELPVFVFLLWLFTSKWGILGTALASALRNALDAAVVFVMAYRGVLFRPVPLRSWLPHAGLVGATAIPVLALPGTWLLSLLWLAFCIPAFAIVLWRLLLPESDRAKLKALSKRLRPAPRTE